jgi:hypothetical protein
MTLPTVVVIAVSFNPTRHPVRSRPAGFRWRGSERADLPQFQRAG